MRKSASFDIRKASLPIRVRGLVATTSSSDDDDAPEEVSTSNWGKETFLSKKQSEQNAKDEIKRIATERRKDIADKIRKRQEESKKQKALKLN